MLARYGDPAFARRYVNYRTRVRREEPHCAATLRSYVPYGNRTATKTRSVILVTAKQAQVRTAIKPR